MCEKMGVQKKKKKVQQHFEVKGEGKKSRMNIRQRNEEWTFHKYRIWNVVWKSGDEKRRSHEKEEGWGMFSLPLSFPVSPTTCYYSSGYDGEKIFSGGGGQKVA